MQSTKPGSCERKPRQSFARMQQGTRVGEKMRVSAEIRRLLRERGWTRADLSRRSGLSSTQLAAYVNAISAPEIEAIRKISAAFEVDESVLTGRPTEVAP